MDRLIENPPIRILGFIKQFFTSRWFKFFAVLVTIIILALIVLYIAVMVAWSNPPLTTYGVALGDLNGDGYLDAFYANGKSEGPAPNTVLINQRGLPGGLVAAFKDTGQRLGKEESSFPILADLDGDGDLDAWVVNIGYQTLYFNDGLGGFSPSGSLFEDDIGGTGLWKVAFGDLDGDGDLDAVGAGCCGAIAYSDEYSGKFFPPFNVVWFNQGGRQAGPVGQFQSDLQMPSLGTTAVALGDLDGDGDQDAFFTNDKYIQSVDGDQGNEPGHPNTVWINPGDGKLADSGQRLGSAHSQNVALGDLDGDGDLDAFVANRGPDKVWLNGGTGQPGMFVDSGQRIGSGYTKQVFLSDLDGDSDLDALLVVQDGLHTEVWFNDGRGMFSDSGQRIANPKVQAYALGDLDGDGDADLFGGWYEAGYAVWWNRGNGTFTP